MRQTLHPFAGDRAQDFAEERERRGTFRCERCGSIWPLPWIEEDGGARRVCRSCHDVMTTIEAQEILADAIERAAGDDPMSLPIPAIPAFTGAVILQSVSPSTLRLTRGGASGAIVLAGLNFSGNVVTASGTGIAVATSVDSPIQITLTISASGGATPGDYDLLFDGDALTPRRILKVR